MIWGMTTSTFTALHVVTKPDRDCHRTHCPLWTADRETPRWLDCDLPADHGINQRDRVRLSLRASIAVP